MFYLSGAWIANVEIPVSMSKAHLTYTIMIKPLEPLEMLQTRNSRSRPLTIINMPVISYPGIDIRALKHALAYSPRWA